MHYARGVVQCFTFLKEESIVHLQIAHALRVTGKQKRYKYQEITRKKMNRTLWCVENDCHVPPRIGSFEMRSICLINNWSRVISTLSCAGSYR